MNQDPFQFRIGEVDCVAVSDGALVSEPGEVPAEVLFATAPASQLESALREAGEQGLWTQWTEQITCLLIRAGGHHVLVDAGAGGLDPATGRLVESLSAIGVAPPDIDSVIISHGHADHIGGLVDAGGSPAFPNARLLLSRREWEFWTGGQAARESPSESAAFLVDFATRTLSIVESRLELVDDEGEAADGVRWLPAPGHTPGHLAVELTSCGERLLCVGDAIIHPLHVAHRNWCSVFDADPSTTARTRGVLCAKAAGAGSLVHAFHFPFPGLGSVVAKREGFLWREASRA